MQSSIYLGSNNYLDYKFRSALKDTHFLNIIAIFFGVVLLAIMAQVALPLPFSPVPITGQTLGVLIIGSFFGAKRAAMTTVAYLVVGSMGLPVFSQGGFGLAKLLGPTGGYLIGFVLAATAMGFLAEFKSDRDIKSALISFAIGHSIVFICGLVWLGFYVGFSKVLQLGFIPFIPGMIIKTILAASITSIVWKKS
jgi:biotin transport system substrate-specific component